MIYNRYLVAVISALVSVICTSVFFLADRGMPKSTLLMSLHKPKPPKSGPVTPDFAHRVRREGGEYDDATLTFTLGWNDRNDLDLHVTSPDGGEIWFHNKRVDGGVLDVDMNIIGDSVEPVENVSWSKAFPRGKYKVRVVYYEKYGPDTTDFTLQVRYGKTTETVSGTVRQVKDQGEYEFDIP